MPHRYHFAALAVLGLIAASQPAAARTSDGPSDTVSTRVSFADLNLQSEAGARTMFRRIHNAAESVCDDGDWGNVWFGDREYRACVRDSTSRAVAQLNNPLVSAMNGEGRGKSQVALANPRP